MTSATRQWAKCRGNAQRFWGAGGLAGGFAVVAMTAAPSVRAFGGEDPFADASKPLTSEWHHLTMTARAATSQCFKGCNSWYDGGAGALAFYADYIDSYLYNPLWWARGPIDGNAKRLWVSAAIKGELEKLHFDDLRTTRQIDQTWQRILGGTLAGLIWAKEQGDVDAALNIVGVSLHAIQDFYSHSTWVDASGRRKQTWFDVSEGQRRSMKLMTGSYEKPDHLHPVQHGKIYFACGILKKKVSAAIMNVACGPVSPLSKSTPCRQYKECDRKATGTVSIRIAKQSSLGLVKIQPGIALDTKYLAPFAAEERGQPRSAGLDMFDDAKALALKTSKQWLRHLEVQMANVPGGGDFWRSMQRRADRGSRRNKVRKLTQPYENYSKFPFMFLSVGPYGSDSTLQNAVYLRLEMKTARDRGAGTDANVRVRVDPKDCAPGAPSGCVFDLDYLPELTQRSHGQASRRRSILMRYNDFERGDRAAYYIGPFRRLPRKITIHNDSASAKDVWKSFKRNLKYRLKKLGKKVKDVALAVIGGHADHVATNHVEVTTPQLDAIRRSRRSRAFRVRLNGKKDGDYSVRGSVRFLRSKEHPKLGPGAVFRVTYAELDCHRESKWDRGSRSDEPFVLLGATGFDGNVVGGIAGPYKGVDKGEKRSVGKRFDVFVPDGAELLLPVALYESDSEGSRRRADLYKRFIGVVVDLEPPPSMLGTIAAAVAAKWKLASMKVFAFDRWQNVRAGEVARTKRGAWFKGDQKRDYALNASKFRRVGVSTRVPYRIQPKSSCLGAGVTPSRSRPRSPATLKRPATRRGPTLKRPVRRR